MPPKAKLQQYRRRRYPTYSMYGMVGLSTDRLSWIPATESTTAVGRGQIEELTSNYTGPIVNYSDT